ncbi:hypothetical protein [Sphingomonas sp. MS122]|uniref:hypothetical protein n=1 Tax=Sphingomonas sp. MS122 TaxID=3412683 RepID=UPI003C2E1211
MAEASRVDVAAILNEASALAGAHPYSFIAAAVANIAFGTWIDSQLWSWNETLALYSVAAGFTGVLQYLVLRRILGGASDRDRMAAIRAPLIAVVIHMLAGIVVGAAFLLLLLPGLYLAGRLSPAVGVAVAEHRGLAESIGESWRRTRPAWRPLLLVQALLLAPLLGFLGLVVAGLYLEWGIITSDDPSIEAALLGNLATGIMAMAGWAVAGAAYRLTAPDPERLDQVFA